MNRAVRATIRFVAAGVIVVSAMMFVLAIVKAEGVTSWRAVLSVICMVLGGVLFYTSGIIANRITDDIDE